MIRLNIAPLLLLSGCGTASISPEAATAAKAWIEREQHPRRVEHIAQWDTMGVPGTMVCGEIKAPEPLRSEQSTLRYIYDDRSAKASSAVEPHSLMVATDDLGDAILQEGRSIFGRTWRQACAPYAPVQRRLAGWLERRSDEDISSDTPLTNAYVADLVNTAR